MIRNNSQLTSTSVQQNRKGQLNCGDHLLEGHGELLGRRDWSMRPPKRRADSRSPYPDDIPPFLVLAEAENLGTQKPRISRRYSKEGCGKHATGFPFRTFPQMVAQEEQRKAKRHRQQTWENRLGGLGSLARGDSELGVRAPPGGGARWRRRALNPGEVRLLPGPTPKIKLRWIETNMQKVRQ